MSIKFQRDMEVITGTRRREDDGTKPTVDAKRAAGMQILESSGLTKEEEDAEIATGHKYCADLICQEQPMGVAAVIYNVPVSEINPQPGIRYRITIEELP